MLTIDVHTDEYKGTTTKYANRITPCELYPGW